MRVLITLGPTYEPLDKVRRLTNFSTGRLGTELANLFVQAGCYVHALRGYYSVYRGELHAQQIAEFTTTEHLLDLLRAAERESWDAIFHAAAVSDFKFGQVFHKTPDGALNTVVSGKHSTRSGPLFVELIPTAKIISELRSLFPSSLLVGWKYEIEGSKDAALKAALTQIQENATDYCVLNGPAYGEGFLLVSNLAPPVHLDDMPALNRALLQRCTSRKKANAESV